MQPRDTGAQAGGGATKEEIVSNWLITNNNHTLTHSPKVKISRYG